MKKKNRAGIEYWLLTLMALGADITDLTDKIINAESLDASEDDDFIQDLCGEKVNRNNLVSSNEKQKAYVAHGYIDEEYYAFQILCHKCKTDRIALDGNKNGDKKFICKNENCDKKYFYLAPFVKSRLDAVTKPVAVWLAKAFFPQNFIALICGVHPSTINNWLNAYDRMSCEEKDVFWDYTGSDYDGFTGWLNSLEDK